MEASHGMGPGGRAARLQRWCRRAAGASLAVAVCAAVAAGTPRLLLDLGAPTAAVAGGLVPTWTAAAAFVRPGVPVAAAAAGRLLALTGAGLVPAGAKLAVVAGAPGPAAAVALVGELQRAPATPASGAGGRPLLCLARRCGTSARTGPPATPAAAAVTAAGTGYFSPGWDPLAALSPGEYSDLPPWVVRDPVLPAPTAGTVLASGELLGVLGQAWSGYWLCALPASAALLLHGSAAATVSWPGGPGPLPVQVAGTGPVVAGRTLAAFAAAALGPDPGPPARAVVTVRLARVSGEIVPAAALVHGTDVVVVGHGERLRLAAVRLRAVVGGRAVVTGLRPGRVVLSRPGRDPRTAPLLR